MKYHNLILFACLISNEESISPTPNQTTNKKGKTQKKQNYLTKKKFFGAFSLGAIITTFWFFSTSSSEKKLTSLYPNLFKTNFSPPQIQQIYGKTSTDIESLSKGQIIYQCFKNVNIGPIISSKPQQEICDEQGNALFIIEEQQNKSTLQQNLLKVIFVKDESYQNLFLDLETQKIIIFENNKKQVFKHDKKTYVLLENTEHQKFLKTQIVAGICFQATVHQINLHVADIRQNLTKILEEQLIAPTQNFPCCTGQNDSLSQLMTAIQLKDQKYQEYYAILQTENTINQLQKEAKELIPKLKQIFQETAGQQLILAQTEAENIYSQFRENFSLMMIQDHQNIISLIEQNQKKIKTDKKKDNLEKLINLLQSFSIGTKYYLERLNVANQSEQIALLDHNLEKIVKMLTRKKENCVSFPLTKEHYPDGSKPTDHEEKTQSNTSSQNLKPEDFSENAFSGKRSSGKLKFRLGASSCAF